ncbi:4-hydroxyphenylpyruvate dioxygenase [Micromonospora sp. DT233]|uniref:4-hydroxyphenylpyruvate dioxygenase n=1 Tax=Micromonospora sp. DT233 TaxID=3393432 RepID=UPI003CEE68E6
MIDDFELDYVEIYVQDMSAQAAVWRDHYGFDEVAIGGSPQQGFRSVLLRQGAIDLVLTEATDARHPAASYVLAHGDGVADIALRTADVRKAFAQVIERGACALAEPREHETDDVVLSASVSGFDDVVHTLVQRRGSGRGLPPGFRPLPQAGGPAEHEHVGEARLAEIDHFAVCLKVGQLDPTVDYYKATFGFRETFEERIAVGAQAMLSKVVQSQTGAVTFTLIQPDPSADQGQIDEFLKEHDGAGVQHIAFGTDNVVEAVRTLSRNGVEFLTTPDAYYGRLSDRVSTGEHTLNELRELNILVDEDHGGQLFQIFTRSMHERRTIFFEVIERRGAETFGSSNIKALYEAVEMDLTR